MKSDFVNARGYRLLYLPEHPMANAFGYVPEHRYVMAEHLGRTLMSDEIVHHINEDPSDNRIENLQVMTKAEHQRHHRAAISAGMTASWARRKARRLRKEPRVYQYELVIARMVLAEREAAA